MGKLAIFGHLDSFVRDFKSYAKEIEDVQKSEMYTETAKEQLIGDIEKKYSPKFRTSADRVGVELDSAISQVKNMDGKASAAKLANAGYQIGLANVVKMVETGSIKTVEDMQNIVNVYKDDRAALNLIQAAARALPADSNGVSLMSVIPEDTRDKNIELLERFKENLTSYISAAARERAIAGFSIAELIQNSKEDFDRMFDEKCKLKANYNGAESVAVSES